MRLRNATVANHQRQKLHHLGFKVWENSLGGSIVFFDITVDESSDVSSSSTGLVCGLREGQFTQQLIKHLDGFLIFSLGVGCI